MKMLRLFIACLMVIGMSACAKEKAKPLVPLTLAPGTSQQAMTLTAQGTQAFQSRQFEEAKTYFSQAVSAAPNSGEAHYNLALALNALGDVDNARSQFIEAANLAPGDKVIWDSPALKPFGNPETEKKVKEIRNSTQRPTIGGVGPR